MSQNVVYPGQDFVFAFHPDDLDLTGVYDLPWTEGGAPPDIVPTPRDFVYAFDEAGRRLDPRRFAGDGGTPLDPGATGHGHGGAVLSAPPRRPGVPPVAPPVPAPPPPSESES